MTSPARQTLCLIDAHGYNPDFDAYTGTSADDGNIRAMYYIIQGLKNTICSPAFTDVRDGVIAAAASAYEGEDVCRIWSAFAEFGLGSNAISSNPDSTTVTNGFAIPTSCDFLFAGPTAQTICAGAPVEYNLRAGTSYTPPVNLVLTGNPAGTTANFTVNPILAVPGLSHLTVGNTAAVPTGLYNMTLTANGDAVNAQALALQVYNGPPSAPTLTAPADGATGAALRPTFQWTATGAQSYVLEIDDNADFSSPVYTSPVLTTTSHQISQLNCPRRGPIRAPQLPTTDPAIGRKVEPPRHLVKHQGFRHRTSRWSCIDIQNELVCVGAHV